MNAISLDRTDLRLLAEIQQHGRATNAELATRVNLSPSPCLRRVRLLEESGVIKGYTAVVDEATYGLPITAFVRIRLERHSQAAIAAFERKVRDIDAIIDCYVMTGDADYLLRVLVESLQDYEAFVRTRLHLIEGIASIDTSFAYGTVKRSTRFPRV